MGKQGNHRQWSGKWPATSAMDGAAQQKYWVTTGSWDNAAQAQGKGKGKEHLFPKYSDVKLPGQAPGGQAAQEVPSQRSQDLDQIKEVQKHVNTIRRIEMKIRKCRELGVQRENQWREFQQQLKASFMEQRAAYMKDREQHRQDEMQLEDQKKLAESQLKALINGSAHQQDSVSSSRDVDADDKAWRDFMEDSHVDADLGEEHDPWLQAALQAATTDGSTDLKAYHRQVSAWLDGKEEANKPGGTATTPPRRMTQVPPMTPKNKPGAAARVIPPRELMLTGSVRPTHAAGALRGPVQCPPVQGTEKTYSGEGPDAVQDPYQTSPEPLAAPCFGTPLGRTTFGKAGDRVSVKLATMQGRHSDRGKVRSQSPQQLGHEQHLAALTQQLGQLNTVGGQAFLIDDDKDEGRGNHGGGEHPERSDGSVEDLTMME